MTKRDLKKASRKELLELLIASEIENEQLRASLQEQEAQLQSRDIKIQDAGSLAEAALRLNGVFEKADEAAAQYLENIKRCSEQQEIIYKKIISEAEQKAKEIIESAEEESRPKTKTINGRLPELWEFVSVKPRKE